MSNEFIKHGITFNNGDVVKHKASEIRMVVVETKHGYLAPYGERIVCKFWHPIDNKFVEDYFLVVELEIVT